MWNEPEIGVTDAGCQFKAIAIEHSQWFTTVQVHLKHLRFYRVRYSPDGPWQVEGDGNGDVTYTWRGNVDYKVWVNIWRLARRPWIAKRQLLQPFFS